MSAMLPSDWSKTFSQTFSHTPYITYYLGVPSTVLELARCNLRGDARGGADLIGRPRQRRPSLTEIKREVHRATNDERCNLRSTGNRTRIDDGQDCGCNVKKKYIIQCRPEYKRDGCHFLRRGSHCVTSNQSRTLGRSCCWSCQRSRPSA
jgi:hypothetical protein